MLPLVISCLLIVTVQGLNCSELDIGTAIAPVQGNSLKFCRNDSLQCCTDQYFEERKINIQEKLKNGLREELLTGNFEIICEIINDLEKFINGTFLWQFASCFQGVDKLPLKAKNEVVNNFVGPLSRNFTINTTIEYSFDTFFNNYLNDLNRKIVDEYLAKFATFSLRSSHRNCIKNQLNKIVNQTAVLSINRNIQKLQRLFYTLDKIKEWYQEDFITNILRTPFVEKCIESFIQLNCAACTRNIPQLCRNTCNYLVQGCFVPYRVGLTFQLNNLWNVTQQIIVQFEHTLSNALSDPENYLHVNFDDKTQLTSFLSNVSRTCGVLLNPSLGKKRRSINTIELPSSIKSNVSLLNGSFSYDQSVAIFCKNYPIKTCWDGEIVRKTVNISDAIDDSIENQDLNPVISFNRTKLVELAESLGTPVNDFLEAFTDIGLDIPPRKFFVLLIEPRAKPQPNSTTSSTESLPTKIISMTSNVNMQQYSSPTNTVAETPNIGHSTSAYSLIVMLLVSIVIIIILV